MGISQCDPAAQLRAVGAQRMDLRTKGGTLNQGNAPAVSPTTSSRMLA